MFGGTTFVAGLNAFLSTPSSILTPDLLISAGRRLAVPAFGRSRLPVARIDGWLERARAFNLLLFLHLS